MSWKGIVALIIIIAMVLVIAGVVPTILIPICVGILAALYIVPT